MTPVEKRFRVVVPAHLGVSDGSEGGGGGDRGAGDRREAGASGDGRQAETAAPMADHRIRGTKQLRAHAGLRDDRAHQHEHRDHAERIVGHRPHRGETNHLQRRRQADDRGVAGDADQAHRHADRHAQQDQREQRNKAGDGDRVRAHGAPRPEMKDPGAHGDQHDRREIAAPGDARRTARSAGADRRSAHCRDRSNRPFRTASANAR